MVDYLSEYTHSSCSFTVSLIQGVMNVHSEHHNNTWDTVCKKFFEKFLA